MSKNKASLPSRNNRKLVTSFVCIMAIVASFAFIDAMNTVTTYAFTGISTPAWGYDAWFCALLLSACSVVFAFPRISRYLNTEI